jgi:3',5'-cyclic AMP phosphodiesterase CpdA
MLIGFLGDVHGQAFHALALVLTWQQVYGRRFDLVVQVGDMGAEPEKEPADLPDYDPYGADFAQLLRATGARAARLQRLRRYLARPVYFLRGNHEDFVWLSRLCAASLNNARGAATSAGDLGVGAVAVDPFDLFRYVLDGTVLDVCGTRLAFLGGVEEQTGPPGIDMAAFEALASLGHGAFDVLVAHEGHYGTSTGYRGDVHGSPLMTRLLEATTPQFFVFGHAHKAIGPGWFGPTRYIGLDGLLPFRKWKPDATGFLPGSLATLDTAGGTLAPVTDSWLSSFPTHPFDFDAWAGGFDRQEMC